jgi:hypothetical protein
MLFACMKICSSCLQVCAKVGSNVIVKLFGDGHKVSSRLWNFLVMEDTKFFHSRKGCKVSLAMVDIAPQDPWVLGWNNKLLNLSH